MIWMLVGALGALLLLYGWTRYKKRAKNAVAKKLRRQLRKLTGDDSVVNRLIARERERHPELSEIALLKKAVRRLARDRR